MKCPKCGAVLEENLNFCCFCGTDLRETEGRECAAPNQAVDERKSAQDGFAYGGAPVRKFRKPRNIFWGIAAAAAAVFIAMIVMNSGKCNVRGCRNKAVKGYDYCYSHKCAESSCSNSKVSRSNYCNWHTRIYTAAAQVYAFELEVSDVRLSSNSSYTIAKGTLTNNSDETVSFVKIKGAFETSSGKVVDTDWTYAVGNEGLAPGESCKWKMSVPKDYKISDCTVTVFDYDY